MRHASCPAPGVVRSESRRGSSESIVSSPAISGRAGRLLEATLSPSAVGKSPSSSPVPSPKQPLSPVPSPKRMSRARSMSLIPTSTTPMLQLALPEDDDTGVVRSTSLRPTRRASRGRTLQDIASSIPSDTMTKKLSGKLTEPSSSMDKVCKQCGNVFMYDAIYCRKCGAKREDSLRQKLAEDTEVNPAMKKLLARSSVDEDFEPITPRQTEAQPFVRNRGRASTLPNAPAISSAVSGDIGGECGSPKLGLGHALRRQRWSDTGSEHSQGSGGSASPTPRKPASGSCTPTSPTPLLAPVRRPSFCLPSEESRSSLADPRKKTVFTISKKLQDSADDAESGTGTPIAGSVLNSRRPSRILDGSDMAMFAQPDGLTEELNTGLETLLKKEKTRDSEMVTSRAYSDHEQESEKSSYKVNKISAKKTNIFYERRSVASVKKSMEAADTTRMITWVLSVMIAVIIALQSSGLLILSRALQKWRLKVVEVSITDWESKPLAFFFLLAYALCSTLVTSIAVALFAPRAQGSGIPEVKAFLNGNAIPQLFTLRTWLVRGLGLLLVTSSGFAAGMQGPCTHLGAIVSAGVARAVFTFFRERLAAFGHRTHCEFASMGAAVGMAAAFCSPVGGILFSMEEASSFWSKGLTWRSFVGSMIAAAIVKTTKTGFRELSTSGFIEFPDSTVGFELQEFPFFLVTAVGTSLLASLFCISVERLANRRLLFYENLGRRRKLIFQVLEALLVAIITITVCFWVPVLLGCSQLPGQTQEQSEWYVGKQDRTICKDGHYSGIGVVLLEHRETAIKVLFTDSFEGGAKFETWHLFFASGILFVLTLLTFGTVLPVGLFIPNILVGACFGRGVGQIASSLGCSVHLGVHALVGAAGMVAGFSRMTVSLTMLILEITNSMRLLLPVMMSILISKAVADRLCESVYDISINLHALQDISLIKGELDEENMPLLRFLTVHDACSVEVITLKCEESPGRIMSTLAQSQFSGFPLVSVPEHQVLGLILRSKLVEALRDYCSYNDTMADPDLDDADAISPTRTSVKIDKTINLVPYADPTPEVKHWNTPLAKAHRHFIHAGMRHLCIVDETHRLVGLLTRSDLVAVSHPRTRQLAIRGMLARKESEISDSQDGWGVSEYSDAESSEGGTSIISPKNSETSSVSRGRGMLRWNAY